MRPRRLAPVLPPCWFALFALVLAAGGRGIAAPATPEPQWGNEVIELPKFDVVDTHILPRPERWRYAEVPGFEILSNLSTHETRRFAEDFLLLQNVIRGIMPVLVSGRSDVPTALVLCGGGKGYNDFLPADRRDEEWSANSLFFENSERTAIVIDFALSELRVDNTESIEADPYRSFYREYFRYLVRRQLGQNTPPWLEEGLVQLFAGIDFTDRWVNFAMIGDGFGGERTGDFNRLLIRHALMPMDEMFNHPAGNDTRWAAQCYAFVHMCLYSTGHRLQKPFLEFVSRLHGEAPTEELFKQCFHESYKDMAIELRGYVEYTNHTYVQFKAKKGQRLPQPAPVAVRDASDAEVGRLKGEVLRLAGRNQEAHVTLIAPYIRGARDPRLLAALGLDERQAGHDARAEKFLEAAARAHVVRARAYLELARLRYDDALRDAKGGRLAPAQVDAVMTPLLVARTQPPPLRDEYALMTEVWSHAASKPTAEQFALVADGVRYFRYDPILLRDAVSLGRNAGLQPQVEALIHEADGRRVRAVSK